MRFFSAKLPTAKWIVGVDWTGLLPAGVTVTSCSVTAEFHPQSANQTGDPSSILVGAPDNDTMRVVQTINGGTVGWKLILTFEPTLSDGQIDPEQVSIKIVGLQP